MAIGIVGSNNGYSRTASDNRFLKLSGGTVNGNLAINSGSISTSQPLTLTQTWTNAAVTYTGLQVNVTDTASAAASLLMDLQADGLSKFRVKTQPSTGPNSNGFLWEADTNGGVFSINGTGNLVTLGASTNHDISLSNGQIQVFRIGVGGGLRIGSAALSPRLYSDSDNTLAQRNGINPQTFRLYNTFTDATTDFERLNFRWDSNVAKIGTQKGTTSGVARDLVLETDGIERMRVAATGGLQFNDTIRIGSGGNNQNGEVRARTLRLSDDTGNSTIRIYGEAFGTRKLTFHAGEYVFGNYSTPVMVIDTTGNVGIDTTSPTSRLDVNGSVRVRTISNAQGNFITTSATGVFQQRTPSEVLADISAEPSFSKNTAFNKNFGNTVGTVAEGNDSRFHDLVTLGISSNGLSLSGQVLSLSLASTSASGALSSTDWNTFNNKENALIFTTGLNRTGNTITNTITQYTDSLARASLSFVAGSGAYNAATGVITIPTNNNQIANGAGYLTSNQNINLLGDVTGSGNTTIGTTISNNAVTTAKILNANITYEKIQNIAADRILGRLSTAGPLQELTAANIRSLINVEDGAQVNVGTNLGSSGTGGSRTITSSTGSSTSITYTTSDLNAVPTSRTLTGGDGINTIGDLSANRTISVNSTVVRTSGNQTIEGIKTISGSIAFTSGVRDGINMNNNNIINVNTIKIADPGVDEGIEWVGGNGWKIYESPNNLTNAGGNLQIIQSSTRRATFNTSGQLEIPISSGTAPFIITSTTRVNNLNVERSGTADAWHSPRTLTIGGIGKLVDGLADVSWSLSEIGVNNATLTLATSGIATGSQTWSSNQGTPATFTINVPGTNIAQGTRTATTVPIMSSTGTGDALDAATTSLAGVMSSSDKTKLDGIAAGAQVNTVTSVAGKTGAVTLVSADVGLSNVTNNAQIKKITTSTNGNIPTWNGATGDLLANGYGVETTLTGNSGNIPRADAVKAYVDSLLSANDAMIFKGTLGSGGTYTSLPTTHNVGWTIKVITAGTYAGKVAEIGDMYVSLVSRSGSGNTNADWAVIQANIDGAVVGPASATTNHVALFEGSTGKIIKSAGAVLGDGVITVSSTGIATISGSSGFSTNQNSNATITVNVPGTDIAQGARTATTVLITSSTGNDATLSVASTTLAGVMSSEDKTKLDGIATGATANTGTVTSIATNNGITGGTITTSGTLGLVGQALALHNLNTNGLIARTGAGTVAGRTLTASTGISISNGDGVLGNPIITNSAPDQVVSLTGSGATTVSGTYPSFTISSTDTNTTYSAGNGIALSGTTFSVANGTGLNQDASGLSLTAITAGDSTVGAVRYNGTTLTTGQFYGGTTNPTGTTRLNYNGNLHATSFVGPLSGNATTATTLINARSINGTNFDGSGNITTSSWGTSRNVTIGSTTRSVDGSTGYNWSLADIGVNNATLTLTTSGIATGSQTFGANQSTNATFTVHVPGTNLAMGGAGNSRSITSSTGDNVAIPIASTSNAGFMSTDDKFKLDGVALGAQAGTVTSVGLSMPNIFTVTNSPVINSGTLTADLSAQNANLILAGPTTGSTAIPTFRSLVEEDVPSLSAAKITTGTLSIARGGTNSSTALNNNRIIISSSSAIVEGGAITANRALISNANGIPTHSSVTNTEINYISGVTSPVQVQLNNKLGLTLNSANIFVGDSLNVATARSLSLNATGGAFNLSNTGELTLPNASGSSRGLLTSTDWTIFNSKQNAITGAATTVLTSDLTIDRVLVSDATGKISASTITSAELDYLSGTSDNIQGQIDAVASSADSRVSKTGDTMTGNLIVQANTTTNNLTVGSQANKATINYTTNTARTLTIPTLAGNRTFSFIDQAETISATKTFSTAPVISQATATLSFSSTTGNKTISTGGNTNLILNPGGTGNVGIGATSPSSKLTVNGDVDAGAAILSASYVSSGVLPKLFLRASATNIGDGQSIDWQWGPSSTTARIRTSAINSSADALEIHTSENGLLGKSVTFGQSLTAFEGSVQATGLNLASGSSIRYGDDLFILRDAPNVIAQRNGSSPQESRIYGTFTNPSNYERLSIKSQAGGPFVIGTESAGAGAARGLAVATSGSTRLTINTSGDVGIGTTSPTEKLHVIGNVKISGTVEPLQGVVLVSPNNTKYLLTVNNDGSLETTSLSPLI
jgi:hypothetical protein